MADTTDAGGVGNEAKEERVMKHAMYINCSEKN
jgi:hypothetical protein